MKYKNYIPSGVKDINAADIKFLEQHIEPKIQDSDVGIQNPWSGTAESVNPLIGTLVEMIYDISYNQDYGLPPHILNKWGLKKTNWISKFDRARYIVLKLDKEIYFNFID